MMRHRPDLCVGGTAAGGTTALSDAMEYLPAEMHPGNRTSVQANVQPLLTSEWFSLSSATPQRMSRSDTSTRVEPERAQHLEQDHGAGHDRRRAVRIRPVTLAALGERQRGQAVAQLLEPRAA